MSDPGAVQSALRRADAPTGEEPGDAAPAPSAPKTPSRRSRWTNAVADRVSTKWIGGGLAAVILAATAAFGGLATAEEPPLPEIAAGETFTGASLEMTPQRAVLIDRLNDTGVFPDKRTERLLIVVLDVVNRDTEPRKTTTAGNVVDVRVVDVPDLAPSIVRFDDATASPWLQPDVPVQLVLAWAVPKGELHEGDEVRVALPAATKFTGSFILAGTYWDDVRTGAWATLPIEDVGAGADA